MGEVVASGKVPVRLLHAGKDFIRRSHEPWTAEKVRSTSARRRLFACDEGIGKLQDRAAQVGHQYSNTVATYQKQSPTKEIMLETMQMEAFWRDIQ